MYIIGHQNFNAGAWNTVKVEVNIPDGYTVTNPTYPDNGQSASAIVTVNGTPLDRKTGGSGSNDSKVAEAGKYGVMTHTCGSSAIKTDGKLAYIGIGGTASDTAPAEGRKVRYDDIKIYKPAVEAVVETYDYPVTVSAASLGFDGVKTTGSKRTVSSSHTADLGAYVIVTFDARNTAGDYPLGVQVCDGKSNGTDSMARANVFANSAIGSDWYTYKLVSGVTDEKISSLALYRKPAGSDVAYTKLTYSTDYETWTSGSGAGSKHVQIGLFYSDKAVSANLAETVWEVRNFQVIDASNGGAVTGKATAKADGTADVKLFYTAKPGATTPIVAVYNSNNQLVDIAYAATPAQGEGVIEANVDYATGNTVKLYVWDGIATGVPVLSNPIPITVQ